MPPSPPPSPPASGAPLAVAGERVILWLFVALSVATALALLWFASFVEPRFRPRVYAALAGDLMVPVAAWFLLKAIGRRRARAAS